MTILGDADPQFDGNVGIGTTTPVKAKLHVLNQNQWNGALVHTDFAGGGVNIAYWGRAEQGDYNVGGQFEVPVSAKVNYGIRAFAGPNNIFPFGNNYNYAGFFNANSLAGGNIGIFAGARPNGTIPGWAGLFYGNIIATGNLISISDVMFKDSIEDITSALSILSELQPKNFVYKTDDFPYMNLNEGHHFGLIAGQVDTVIPELVFEVIQPELQDSDEVVLMDSTAFKSINYTGLIPITIAAINELNEEKVASDATDSNFVTKWSPTHNVLTTSILYDNGSQVGISTTEPVSKTTILNGSVPASFSSGIAELEENFDVNIASENIALTVFSSTDDTVNIGTLFIAENDGAVNIGGGSSAHGDDAIINIGWAVAASGDNVENANAAMMGTAAGEGSVNYGVLGQGEGGTRKCRGLRLGGKR